MNASHRKPVAIFRHSVTEGPGYFATFLDRHRIPWRLVRIDADDPISGDVRAFSGLALMGGPMSANDALPWITQVLALISSAVASDIPVLGHCLGAQLMAKALGGAVTRNPVKEIGWGSVTVEANADARLWFGATREFLGFHWHGETFSVPPGATRIATSAYCTNQAFVMGRHLGMQCHVEMTPELIRLWCENWRNEVASLARLTPSVQTPPQMEETIEERCRALNAVSDGLYARWIEGLES